MDAIVIDAVDIVASLLTSLLLFMFGVMWGIGGLYCKRGSRLRGFCLTIFIVSALLNLVMIAVTIEAVIF